MKLQIVERLSRLLATMTGSGIPLVDAISIAQHSAGNQIFIYGLGYICRKIREGEGFAIHLRDKELFLTSATYMIRVGEETGTLPEMFEKVADIYGTEEEVKIKAFLSLAEPVVILITVGVVLIIVMLILLPILRINDIFF